MKRLVIDTERAMEVLVGLTSKENKFGEPYCPCNALHAQRNVCPCDMALNYQVCHCGMFKTIEIEDLNV